MGTIQLNEPLTNLDPGRPPARCRFDPDAIRAWLDSRHPDGGAPIAETLRLRDDFDIYGFDKWVRITDLVAAAQTAGVFGIDGHTIEVLHLAGEHGFVNTHRVTLAAPGHATVCSEDLDTAELLTDHLHGVDAAVHLLAQTANTADKLVALRAGVAHSSSPGLPKRAAKAFRPLAIDPTARRVPTPPPTPAESSRSRHT